MPILQGYYVRIDNNPTPNLDVLWIGILQPQPRGSLIHAVHGCCDGRARLRGLGRPMFFLPDFWQRCLEMGLEVAWPLIMLEMGIRYIVSNQQKKVS
jgi:hypothetical protein